MGRPKDFTAINQLTDDTELYTQGGDDSVRGDFKFTLGQLKSFLNEGRQTIKVETESTELSIQGVTGTEAIYRNGILMENVDAITKRADAVFIENGVIKVHASFKFRPGERIDIF